MVQMLLMYIYLFVCSFILKSIYTQAVILHANPPKDYNLSLGVFSLLLLL